MRDIKFRGKRADNGEWVVGGGIHFPKSINYKGRVFIDGMQERANDWLEIIPSTVGQYTGLKDKNGVEIFEGDMVHCWGGECCQGYWEYSTSLTVYDLSYCVVEMSESENIEVIGNIHDREIEKEGGK